MKNAASKIYHLVKSIDSEFTVNIQDFLESYNLPENSQLFLYAHLASFIKASIYSLVLVVPVSILKLIYSTNKIVLAIFILVLTILGVSLFATFLGLFQLAFI